MRNKLILFFSVLLLLTLGNVGLTAAQETLADWTSIFNADGSVNNLSGGFDAVFLEDNISAGIAVDMTAFDSVNKLVYNGPVKSAHDIGNGLVFASRDAFNNLVISAAVERLKTNANTYVDFSFYQDRNRVTTGSPWPVYGETTVNDAKLRFNYIAGNLTSVEFGRWNGTSYDFQSSSPPSQTGCFVVSSSINFCNGSPIGGLPLANKNVWDESFQMVQVPDADGFLQVQINFGNSIEFSSVVISTPQDISLGSFLAMGYWGNFNNTLASQ